MESRCQIISVTFISDISLSKIFQKLNFTEIFFYQISILTEGVNGFQVLFLQKQ